MNEALLTLTATMALLERYEVLARVVGQIFLFDSWRLLVLLVANGSAT